MPERRLRHRESGRRLLLKFPAPYTAERTVALVQLSDDGSEDLVLVSREAADWRAGRIEAAKMQEQLAARGYLDDRLTHQNAASELEVPMVAGHLEQAQRLAQRAAQAAQPGKATTKRPGKAAPPTTQPTPPAPPSQGDIRQIRLED